MASMSRQDKHAKRPTGVGPDPTSFSETPWVPTKQATAWILDSFCFVSLSASGISQCSPETAHGTVAAADRGLHGLWHTTKTHEVLLEPVRSSWIQEPNE